MLKITEIKIDELYPSNEPQVFEELTIEEIHEIWGGLGEIDSPDSDDIDTNDVSSLLKYIDEEGNNLVTDIGNKIKGMRKALGV